MSYLQSSLLSILRCPVSGGRLHQENDELVSDTPDAAGQLLRYPIQEGIANLLPAEHRSIPHRDGESA
ncbi:Trm112 family protein [Psychromicrobium sp. YIM B11713]|uniref:Trm112 family protein n=1 Tax=Psychromicrobium sp. YIM B11713 TaxID=3145233 RepID=UPI00374FD9AD